MEGGAGQDLCCPDEVVQTRANVTMCDSCEKVDWMSDKRVVAQECCRQSDQLRRNDVERIEPIRFHWCSSMNCRASGRGGVLGIALMWTTHGKVYNGITDDDTHDDILNLSIVYLLWNWGLVVGRVAARVLPGVSRASLCTLPLLFWSLFSGRSSKPRSELNESTRLSK